MTWARNTTPCWPSLSSTKKRKHGTESSPTSLSIPTTEMVFQMVMRSRLLQRKQVGIRDLVKPPTVRLCEHSGHASQAAGGPTRGTFLNKSKMAPGWTEQVPVQCQAALEMMTVRNRGMISMCASQAKTNRCTWDLSTSHGLLNRESPSPEHHLLIRRGRRRVQEFLTVSL